MQLRPVHLRQAGGGDGLVVERFEELPGAAVEVFLEERLHLAGRRSKRGSRREEKFPPGRADDVLFALRGLTSRYLRFRALSSRTCRVRMYSGGSRWLKEHRPWPSLM